MRISIVKILKMNEPIGMYKTKQMINYNFSVELPKCMYSLKSIHSGSSMVDDSGHHELSPRKQLDISNQVKQFLKNYQHITGMAEIEAKQAEILKQLADLKKQILSIKSDLKINSDPSVILPTDSITKKLPALGKVTNNFSDIVINANPAHPPYSLDIIQKLLQDNVNFKFSSHIHSSIKYLPENTKDLNDALINFRPKSNLPIVNVRLIWKNIDTDMVLLVSHTPILGEVNFLRYLARGADSILSYSSDSDCVKIDCLLDICYILQRTKTKTVRGTLLHLLNKSLGKSQWMLQRNCASVADIAAYSAIKQVTTPNEINVNLGKWLQRCEAIRN